MTFTTQHRCACDRRRTSSDGTLIPERYRIKDHVAFDDTEFLQCTSLSFFLKHKNARGEQCTSFLSRTQNSVCVMAENTTPHSSSWTRYLPEGDPRPEAVYPTGKPMPMTPEALNKMLQADFGIIIILYLTYPEYANNRKKVQY